jgi:CYTH domain
MTADARKMEHRYESKPGTVLPSLDGLPDVSAVSASPVENLEAEYYDTDDLRLLNAGVTVRRRDEWWHLRLPGPRSSQEVQLPEDREGDPVPDELTRLIQVHARGAALRPVAHIETRRHRTSLRDAAGVTRR